MDLPHLRVSSFLSEDEVSLSKIWVNNSWMYLMDPAAPIIFDIGYSLNTKVEIVLAENYFGTLDNWTAFGMGGQVINGSADLGGDASLITLDRRQHLDFLHPTHSERFSVYFKQPNAVNDYGLLLKPFTWQIWLSISFMWIVIMASFTLIKFLSKTIFANTSAYKEYDTTVGDFVLWSIASICGRSYTLQNVATLRTSILIICGTQFGMIVLSIYSGFIVSSLAIKSEPIKSFRDLVNHGYQIMSRFPAVEFSGFTSNLLESHKLQIASRDFFIDSKDSVTKVISSDPANAWTGYIAINSNFHKLRQQLGYSEKEGCKLSKIPSTINYPLAMFVKKGSRLREALNQKILLVSQTGLKRRYLKHSRDLVIPMCDRLYSLPEPLTFANIQVAVWFVISVYCMCLIFLIMERVLYAKK